MITLLFDEICSLSVKVFQSDFDKGIFFVSLLLVLALKTQTFSCVQ